jgi:hypothetical protein
MADQKLTALTAVTSASADDIVYIVDDPLGSPLSRKITFDNLQKSITAIGVLSTNVEIPLANYVYIGPNGSDGSWRFRVVDGNLAFEKREGGNWIEKGLVTA